MQAPVAGAERPACLTDGDDAFLLVRAGLLVGAVARRDADIECQSSARGKAKNREAERAASESQPPILNLALDFRSTTLLN